MAPSNEVTETLEQRRERLRQVVSEKTAREKALTELVAVEQQIAAQAAAALKADAEARLLDIVRAIGGLANAKATKADDDRFRAAAIKFAEAAKALNDRHEQIVLLKAEALALVEVFGLLSPDLPTILPPSMRPEVAEAVGAARVVANADRGVTPLKRWEKDEQGRLRPTGRSFEELKGTPGFDLIARAKGSQNGRA